jgi:hypothetical protein
LAAGWFDLDQTLGAMPAMASERVESRIRSWERTMGRIGERDIQEAMPRRIVETGL